MVTRDNSGAGGRQTVLVVVAVGAAVVAAVLIRFRLLLGTSQPPVFFRYSIKATRFASEPCATRLDCAFSDCLPGKK